MWQPTHVQVTVQKARGVLIKGKNDTNDAFVVIAVGKEKFQTSIKERSSINVEWHEECDLEIPRHGNTASLSLTLYHRNSLGMDEFLGQVNLPLSEFDVYERPRTRLLKLQSKPDKAKKKAEKDRGEIEVKIAFIVKSGDYLEPGKKEKHKSSLTSIKHLGGSLLSLGNKDRNGLKKFTKSVSNRMDKLVPKKKKSSSVSDDYIPPQLLSSRQWGATADPGVISDEEDDLNFDDMKVTGGGATANSSPYSITSRASSHRHKLETLQDDESLNEMDYPAPQIVHHAPSSERAVGSLEALSHANSSHSSLNNSCASSTHDLHPMDHSSLPRLPEVKALTLDRSTKLSPYDGSPDTTKKAKRKGFKSRLFSKSGGSRERVEEEYSHRVVEGGNDKVPNAPLTNPHSRLSQEIHNKFAGKSREDLMEQILSLQSTLDGQVHHSRDLEEYIDNLLLRVLDASPHLLQAPVPTHPSSRSKSNYMTV